MRPALTAAVVVAVVVQVWVLYQEEVPSGVPAFAHADKLGHVLVFAVPAFLAVRLGGRTGWSVLVLLLLHAPVSELVQGLALDRRSGDPWDAVADLLGVAVGVALAWVLPPLLAEGRGGPDPQRAAPGAGAREKATRAGT